MRKLALFGAWTLVVVLTTAITWQIVGLADDRVSERPASPLNVAAPEFDTLNTATSITTASPTLTEPSPTTSVTSASVTTTTEGTATETLPTTTTLVVATTATAVDWKVKSISTEGGTVVVKYRPGEVVLQAATPGPGFRAEVEKSGPPEVEVEFESEEIRIEVHAKWDGGELNVEVSESD